MYPQPPNPTLSHVLSALACTTICPLIMLYLWHKMQHNKIKPNTALKQKILRAKRQRQRQIQLYPERHANTTARTPNKKKTRIRPRTTKTKRRTDTKTKKATRRARKIAKLAAKSARHFANQARYISRLFQAQGAATNASSHAARFAMQQARDCIKQIKILILRIHQAAETAKLAQQAADLTVLTLQLIPHQLPNGIRLKEHILNPMTIYAANLTYILTALSQILMEQGRLYLTWQGSGAEREYIHHHNILHTTTQLEITAADIDLNIYDPLNQLQHDPTCLDHCLGKISEIQHYNLRQVPSGRFEKYELQLALKTALFNCDISIRHQLHQSSSPHLTHASSYILFNKKTCTLFRLCHPAYIYASLNPTANPLSFITTNPHLKNPSTHVPTLINAAFMLKKTLVPHGINPTEFHLSCEPTLYQQLQNTLFDGSQYNNTALLMALLILAYKYSKNYLFPKVIVFQKLPAFLLRDQDAHFSQMPAACFLKNTYTVTLIDMIVGKLIDLHPQHSHFIITQLKTLIDPLRMYLQKNNFDIPFTVLPHPISSHSRSQSPP